VVVGLAGLAMTIGLVTFAIGRVVLGVAGSPDAVASVVDDFTALPEVRAELVDELTAQFATDPMIAEYADEETVRNAVESVLDSEQFADFTDAASSAAYQVFFEGEARADIDVDVLAEVALERLAEATDSAELAELATEFGITLEDNGVIDEGTVDDVAAEVDRISSSIIDEGVEPITLERTDDDPDLASIVDSVRFWSNVALGLAVLAAVVMLAVSPVGFLRRLLSVGIAIGASGALLIGVSRFANLLPLDNVDRSDMIRAIADSLLGRAAGPGYTMLIIGVVLIGIGVATRFVPERRR
jgi:hypothetical protein